MSPGTMGVQIHTEWGPKASLISSWPRVTRPVWVLPHPHPQPPRGLCSLHPNQVWMSYFWLGFLPFWLVFGTFWQLLFFTCKIKRCFIILAGFWNFLHLFGNFWGFFNLFYCFHNILVLLDHLWPFTKIFAILMAHPFQILWPPQKLQTLQKPQRFQPPEKPHLPPVFQKLLQMVSLNHGIT